MNEGAKRRVFGSFRPQKLVELFTDSLRAASLAGENRAYGGCLGNDVLFNEQDSSVIGKIFVDISG